jgi:hypothetical protein
MIHKLDCGCEIDLFFNWQGHKMHKIVKKCKKHSRNNKLYVPTMPWEEE